MLVRSLILFFFLVFEFCFAQNQTDSTYADFIPNKLNSLQTDWNIFTSPIAFYLSNSTHQFNSEMNSLYSMFTSSQMNSGLYIANPNQMLNQFQLANNWETQKKYGVFAKYLGIAQFMGAIGIAAVHISKFYAPPKGKVKIDAPKTPQIERP